MAARYFEKIISMANGSNRLEVIAQVERHLHQELDFAMRVGQRQPTAPQYAGQRFDFRSGNLLESYRPARDGDGVDERRASVALGYAG